MFKPKVILFAAPVLGIAAGVVRGMSLSLVFDKNTALPTPNHPLTWTLFGLAAVTVLMSLFVKFGANDKGGVPPVVRLLTVLACVVLTTASVNDIVNKQDVITVILSSLGLISAGMTLLLAASRLSTPKRTLGLYATVPVFWACFWFLSIFFNNSANPVLLSYIVEFFAVFFTLMTCYSLAGFYFDVKKPRMFGISVTTGLFFTIAALLAPLAAQLYAPETSMLDSFTASGAFRLLFALLYIAAAPFLANAAENMPSAEPEVNESESEVTGDAGDQTL